MTTTAPAAPAAPATTATAATAANPAALIRRLRAAAAALSGRKGVAAARALADRVAAAHAAHTAQMGGSPRARSAFQIAEGRRLRAAALVDAANGYPLAAFGRPLDAPAWAIRPLTNLEGEGRAEIARVGGWWISTSEEVEEDWGFYSRAWHRKHGPKVRISNRTVQIRRFDPKTGLVENRDQAVAAWRGNWALNALIAAGIITQTKVPPRLRPVQLHPAYGVSLHRRIGGAEIYRRTLSGGLVDYCVLFKEATFHAQSPMEAVRGLKIKLAATKKQQKTLVDRDLCISLGFCPNGIKQFCLDFGLDPQKQYTFEEISTAASRDRERARVVYGKELGVLARAVGAPHTAQRRGGK